MQSSLIGLQVGWVLNPQLYQCKREGNRLDRFGMGLCGLHTHRRKTCGVRMGLKWKIGDR